MIDNLMVWLLLLAHCTINIHSSLQDDNFKNRNKRLMDENAFPYWRHLQRNRQVTYQPFTALRTSLSGFLDPRRPLFMRHDRANLFDAED